MPNLLEITGDDIAQLDDADLRTLIGLLCEEDYRKAGFSTKGITWGGHQDAADGGLDVVVRDKASPPQNSFVPRSVTGFQVKKPDMPKSKIPGEMKLKGALRKSIKELIKEKGAYIIVSSGASTTSTALNNRIDAMRKAVSTEDNHQNLHLDFFDRGRVATWVRSHPSLILWVLDKIGRQLKGWCPYINWANPKAGIDEEYLFDDKLRLHDGTSRQQDNGLSVQDGIQQLRSKLSIPGTSVRLTGLSGVGKTRLAQAMFDARIGEQELNPDQAFYTDIAFSPEPDPRVFAEQLIAGRTRAILIVDNCPPDLHHILTKTCSVQQSTVSLLSIEYDVREDLPEETSVFRLEPASEDLIQKLIMNRFAHISQVDARTIADFSGGNARVAIALANTVAHGESVSGLRDETLFERLFQQRHGSNKDLLTSAMTCSLVYSFEGTDTESEKSELNFLASLIDKPGSELFRDVATIKDRDLIQSRDVWRAVLPQAIANRLAKRALEAIPKDKLVNAFLQSGSERLIKSFSRRLGYLHDCEKAVQIVDEWLKPDGWLGATNCNFNDFGIEVFRNIAPVSPEKALEAIERAANGDDGSEFTSKEHAHYDKFVWLLRHLAYDSEMFNRSAEIICRYALSEKPDGYNNSARNVLKSFFYIHLSGTHATVEARAKIIEELVDSQDQDRQELGLYLLEATLEAWHFTSSYDFRFGARSRDYGCLPKTSKEIEHWYETFIDICTRLAISDKSVAEKAKKILGDKLRGLWINTRMFEILENSAKQIHKKQPWNEGWTAVKNIIKFDAKRFSKKVTERIKGLENILRPNSLYELVRTYVFSNQHISFALPDINNDDDEKTAGWEKVAESAQMLGVQVAQDDDALKRLLPDFVSASNPRIRALGRGLAKGCTDKQALWQDIRAAFETTQPEKRYTCIMEGFLSACAEIEPDLYNSILDDLILDDLLCEWFPIFQTASNIDHRGVERLKKALEAEIANIEYYRNLAWGRAHEAISDDDLASLLEKILSREDGIGVAIEILAMRFYAQKDPAGHSLQLVSVARDVLRMYQLSEDRRRRDSQDQELSEIAMVCLNGKDGIQSAEELCKHLVQAIIDDYVYTFDYSNLFNSLSRAQPFVFLDAFIGNDRIKPYQRQRMFNADFESRDNPLDQISDDDLIIWCEKDPESRYPLITLAIQPFKECDGKLTWKPVMYRIFDRAPDLGAIFNNIAYSMIPKSWSGSRADIMQNRSVLYKELYEHDNAEIMSLAKAKYSELQRKIIEERQSEGNLHRRQFESFE
jgi:hypothetical protein